MYIENLNNKIKSSMQENLHFCSNEFGFDSVNHFLNSLFRPNLLNVTLPTAMIGSFIQYIFGLDAIVLLAFVSLLTLELVTGIFAAWIEGQEITSKRMKAFLMMLFVWLVILFVINIFKMHFHKSVGEVIFGYLFNTVIIFVNLIYFKSIWENIGRITGRKNEFKKIAEIFAKKLDVDEK